MASMNTLPTSVVNEVLSGQRIITSPAELAMALHELLGRCDFASIGAVKDHFEKIEDGKGGKEKTENVTGQFLTAQIRLPKGTPITIGGEQYYPTTLAFKIDAFHLEGERPQATATGRPAAATLSNAELLKQRMAATRAMGAPAGTTEIRAVPASHATPPTHSAPQPPATHTTKQRTN